MLEEFSLELKEGFCRFRQAALDQAVVPLTKDNF